MEELIANKYAPLVAKLHGELFNDSLLPLTEKHLSRIEAQLGQRLPDDYRKFLRDYAGVTFSAAHFPMLEDYGPTTASISMFYGSNEEATLADLYHQGRENYGILENGYKWYPGLRLVRDISRPVAEMEWPEELLPIGCDDGGNQICLALFGLRPGAIFWWRNAPFGDAENLYLIAETFDEFMHALFRGD